MGHAVCLHGRKRQALGRRPCDVVWTLALLTDFTEYLCGINVRVVHC